MGTATGSTRRLRGLLSFPDPVNEVSARLVAAGVLAMSLAAIVLDLRWLTIVIAYGFWARVLTGPTLSPLGQLVTRGVTPQLPFADHPVAGPPKRFAQGVGAVFSTPRSSSPTASANGVRPRWSCRFWPTRPPSSRPSASASAAGCSASSWALA